MAEYEKEFFSNQGIRYNLDYEVKGGKKSEKPAPEKPAVETPKKVSSATVYNVRDGALFLNGRRVRGLFR